MTYIRKVIFPFFLLFFSCAINAQNKKDAHLDSLLVKFSSSSEDTSKINLGMKIAWLYQKAGNYQLAAAIYKKGLATAAKLNWAKGIMRSIGGIGAVHEDALNYDTAIVYYKKALQVAGQHRDILYLTKMCRSIGRCYLNLTDGKRALVYALKGLSYCNENDTSNQHIVILSLAGAAYQLQSDYKTAFTYFLKAKELCDHGTNSFSKAVCNFYLGSIHRDLHEYPEAIKYDLLALNYYQKIHRTVQVLSLTLNIGVIYDLMKDYDKAILYEKKALEMSVRSGDDDRRAAVLNDLANEYFAKKDYSPAYRLNLESMAIRKQINRRLIYSFNSNGQYLSEFPDSVLKKFGVNIDTKYRKAIDYFNRSNKLAEEYQDFDAMKYNYEGLSRTYERIKDYKQAYSAYQQFIAYRDSDYSDAKKKDFTRQQLQYEYGRREDSLKYQQTITGTQLKAKQTQQYYFIGGLVLLGALIFFVWMNYLNQKKSNQLITAANRQLSEQQEEITAQRDQLSTALTDLKATQNQLIQSEKMASLGELTAGIAHEIQNPLNFVNNFSDINMELVQELAYEIEGGNIGEVKAIANSLKENEAKIKQHGKRAEAIVKSMLEHSRIRNTARQPTDLNKLTAEYLDLSCQAGQAKDGAPDVKLVANYDKELPLVNVAPQDIGQVLLNLFSNAFYAVKQKTAGPEYTPTIVVSTFMPYPNWWAVKVRDNGVGIAGDIKNKILQPFFTTKPAGQGTGLGLSLSYDIIVKGYSGELKMPDLEGDGAEFIIAAPFD